MILRTRRRLESFDVLRRRMIRETEAALEYGLLHPQTIAPIPVVEVGKGSFDPSFAHWFWHHALELSDDDDSGLNR